ncbi:MAG: hypothetical protein KF832_08695 [Caldilineaceae bacterium]|nr:hypothetical protein [Caldilineaceae bacterium]
MCRYLPGCSKYAYQCV